MSQASAYRPPAYDARRNDAGPGADAVPDDSRHYVLLAAVALAVAAAALVFYLRQNAILLYGDAVAHINIARRVFDSRTPGLFQLGTVWLPLPHLLDIPFVINARLWQTGVGASIPTMLAYVAGCLGIFRLLRGGGAGVSEAGAPAEVAGAGAGERETRAAEARAGHAHGGDPRGMVSPLAAWTATLVFALNPNLIYMQSTAMTETLYLALFIWTVVFFSEFVQAMRGGWAMATDSAVVTTLALGPGQAAATQQAAGTNDPAFQDNARRARKSLQRCAMALSAAMLVRYDAWFLAVFVGAAVVYVWWRGQDVHRGGAEKEQIARPGLRASAVIMFLLLPMLTGALWLAYNHIAFGNALEFANGPFSPRAIQARSWTPTWTSYPGENSARTATLYFLKVSRLNLGEGRSEYLLFAVAFVALLAVLFFARRYLPWTLLWLPAIFYPACIAWGSVPVYVPQWWPFGYYNVRYGLQLLPAVAVFVGLLVEFTAKFFPRLRCPAAALLLLLAGWSYGSVWRHTPISLREAQRNGAARMDFEQRLGAELAKLPPESTIMMDCSSYSGAVQSAGIPFRRVLRESNPPYWEIALSRPAQSADYVVAIDRDDVALAVRRSSAGLQPVAQVESSDGHKAVIYRSSEFRSTSFHGASATPIRVIPTAVKRASAFGTLFAPAVGANGQSERVGRRDLAFHLPPGNQPRASMLKSPQLLSAE